MDLFQFREPVCAWTHGIWMVLAVPATLLLVKRSRGNLAKQLSLLIFGVSFLCCFTASTFFHAVHCAQWIPVCYTLDHIGIYLLIAGTFTPPAVVLLRGAWKWSMLGIIWSLAVSGIICRLVDRNMTMSTATAFYMLMGWSSIFFYFELARILPYRGLRLLTWGSVVYGIGALINLAHWPDPWPDVFGHHEIFHLLAMAGSVAHFRFMLDYIAPYEAPTLFDLVPTAPRIVQQRIVLGSDLALDSPAASRNRRARRSRTR